MGYKTAFREVMREYDRDRGRAQRLLEERQEEAYRDIPRIKEIDEEITATGFQIAKEILRGVAHQNGVDGFALAERMKARNRGLTEEKQRLLAEHGYPPDFFTDIYRCGSCRDTGFVEADEAGGQPRQQRCVCLRQRLIAKSYDLSNLGDVLARENFDTFDLRYYSEQVDPAAGLSPRAKIQVIYRICLDFVLNFDDEFNNLLFYGDTGLGKTFLCNCIAKDILDRGKTVLYITAPQICKVIEEYRFNRSEMEEPNEYIDAVTDVDLLIIDDLGTEFATVVTSSELFHIINARLLAKKHTVISTNLAPSDFENQYSERLISRFFGYYRMLKFLGEDIRMKKKYGSEVKP